MNRSINHVVLATALLSSLTMAAHADMTKAQVETIVQDYISTHGDDIMASVTKAQQQKQLAAMAHLIRSTTPTRGPAAAPVTIVEFADFECPFCERSEPTLQQLNTTYGNKIHWAFKFLPLEFHKNAMPAAQAAAAAHLQGKFWEFAKTLFDHQDQLGDKLYTDTAKGLKLDMKKFEADRNSPAVKAQIAQDLADAESVGARGTPFFLINGQAVSGAMPLEEFTKVIDAELKAPKTK